MKTLQNLTQITHAFVKASLIALCISSTAQATNLCGQVWHGTVERVRVQEQADNSVVVRVYIYPGNNADYVGYTTSNLMVDQLIKSKDNLHEITGYTDTSCKIKWMDYQ